VPGDLLGKVRVRVDSVRPIFVGIGREQAVDSYLAGVAHTQGTRFDARNKDFRTFAGGAPGSLPAKLPIWAASATGTGPQTLTWSPQHGNWRVVVMNANGSAGVGADVRVGARLPHLETISIAVLGAGLVLLMLGGGAMYLVVRRRH